MRIVVLGKSVALAIRSPHLWRYARPYAEWLRAGTHVTDPRDFVIDPCAVAMVPDGTHFSASRRRRTAQLLQQLLPSPAPRPSTVQRS